MSKGKIKNQYTSSGSPAGNPSQPGSSCGINEPDPAVNDPGPKEEKSFRISVFFDGTENNQRNIEQKEQAIKELNELERIRLRIEDDIKTKKAKKIPVSNDEHNKLKEVERKIKKLAPVADAGGSYAGAITNVARLHNCLSPGVSGMDAHFKIYVGGIGTEDYGKDSTWSKATGKGSLGVISKVAKGVDICLKLILGADCPDKSIAKLELDAVGFSRGATAARNFIHAATQNPGKTLQDLLTGKGYSVGQVEMRFTGLFDTVAAYGLSNHHKDTASLNLDAVVHSTKVVHLIAGDEYRNNFPVTNIKSKGSVEITLPGVHSDVGGGYADNKSEIKLEVFDLDTFYTTEKHKKRLNDEMMWLINEGWCLQEEIEMPNFWNEIKINRKGLRNTYALIPLHIMKKYMKDELLRFTPEIDIDSRLFPDSSHPDIRQMMNIIGPDGTGNWKSDIHLLKRVRNRYFHFSANYKSKFVSEPRFKDGKGPLDGPRERLILDG